MPHRKSTAWCPTCGAPPCKKCMFTGGPVKGLPMSTLHTSRIEAEGRRHDTNNHPGT